MAASYSHNTRADGITLTAAIYNADHQNHIDNMIPEKIDDESSDLPAMKVTTDPYPGAVADLATSLEGELHRIRYLIQQITGQTFWYEDPARRGALVYRTVDESINASTPDTFNWDAEDYDTDSIHDNVTNNQRLTVPAGVSAVRLAAQVNWSSMPDQTRVYTLISKNGGAYTGRPYTQNYTSGTGSLNQNVVTPVLDVVAGDYFEVGVYHESSSGPETPSGGANESWFSMEIVR